MKNENGEVMSIEEAQSLLQQVLMTLAKNSVHNKRLLEYADELERYIAFLTNNKQEVGDQTDDDKTE